MRFTVFSNDAIVSLSAVGGNNRPRKFEWTLNVGSVTKYKKVAIESIFCRNTRAVLQTGLKGLVKGHKMIKTGDVNSETYMKNFIYNTKTLGSGTGLIIQNRRHINAGGNMTQLLIMNRGVGYKVGEIITVLDANNDIPSIENRATFEITSISDDSYDHDLTAIDSTSDEQMMRMIAVGNCDEKELFSIRSPSFGEHYDTRGTSFKNGGSLLYMGPLKLQNTNPKDAFCYDLKSSDFLNGSFEMSVDSNFLAENGISSDIVFGVSFVLME